MLKRTVISAVVLLALLLAGTAQAQLGDDAPAYDERVGDILDELELKYTIDDDGDFRVIFGMGDGRSQLAFIMSDTNEYLNLEIREIWSFGYRAPSGEFPGSIANKLLEDTFPKKLGAWAKLNDRAVFVVKLSANADSESLLSALTMALEAADEMEKSLSGDTDEF